MTMLKIKLNEQSNNINALESTGIYNNAPTSFKSWYDVSLSTGSFSSYHHILNYFKLIKFKSFLKN